MLKKIPEEFVRYRMRSSTCTRSSINEQQQQQISMVNRNSPVVIDSDNEDDCTSTDITEEDDEEEQKNYQTGNILQPICSFDHQTNVCTETINIAYLQANHIFETVQINNDQLLAQTMVILATKFQHTKPINSIPTEHDILSFVGPCPLYSLTSSFGLDMQHGLSNFPCRDVLADGGGHIPATPLWLHLTVHHNLNISSSSLIISHIIIHGYSSSSPILFSKIKIDNLLRTTPRFCLTRRCPLTTYGIYGIQFEHGTRLCSGFTYNTNIYVHLISFHKMTDDAALRLSRAIAFHDKKFKFLPNEIILNEYIKWPLGNKCRIKKRIRHHVTKKILRTRPVTKNSD